MHPNTSTRGPLGCPTRITKIGRPSSDRPRSIRLGVDLLTELVGARESIEGLTGVAPAAHPLAPTATTTASATRRTAPRYELSAAPVFARTGFTFSSESGVRAWPGFSYPYDVEIRRNQPQAGRVLRAPAPTDERGQE